MDCIGHGGESYGSYATLEEAKTVCASDNNCQGVYDIGCTGDSSMSSEKIFGKYRLQGVHLCPNSYVKKHTSGGIKKGIYVHGGSSCIYQKNKGILAVHSNIYMIKNIFNVAAFT